MKITHTEIYKLSIPMHPFTISTGTMHFAQNIFIRIHTDADYYGVGECSAFPIIAGESQATCFEMAKDFAGLWKNKDPLEADERLNELDKFTAFNTTIKSAFDMALFDIAAKDDNRPLFEYLGGAKKALQTDLTIGIGTPEQMAAQAAEFIRRGVTMIKIKLGKNGPDDIERVKQIREAVGKDVLLRIDANQGWDYPTALEVLQKTAVYDIQFCEQPMKAYADGLLPALRRASPIKIMLDESVFDHHDAERLMEAGACDYINIKFAKSGGIREAIKINAVCEKHHIPCMLGGMLESRLALTAFAHFALTSDNIIFYDMDTCLLGHRVDPVLQGVQFRGFFLELPESPGIGADIAEDFLATCESVTI